MLLANGHAHANHYSIAKARTEALIIVSRQNNLLATEALLMQSAIVSVLDKKGAKSFSELIKRLTNA